MTTRRYDWNDLSGQITGQLLLPSASGAPMMETPPRPGLGDVTTLKRPTLRAQTPGDVVRAVLFARQHGLRVSPRSGGHCFAGWSSSGDLIVDVTAMDTVGVHGEAVTVGAGARLGDLDRTLQRRGLALPTGCGRTVGIAGLTLGGGLGLLGRRYGLTCDRLRSAQVVLADGRLVECDRDRDADLFWGLRGAGGGQFGVVVSLTLAAVPAPNVACFHLTWTHATAEIIRGWQDWAPTGPAELSAELRVRVGPGVRQPSAELLGTLLLTPSSVSAGRADRLLDTFIGRVGGRPDTDTRRVMGYHDAKRHLTGEAVHAGPQIPADWAELSKSEFFNQPLPGATIDDLLILLATPTPHAGIRQLNFTPWAGAYNRPAADDSAFAHRDQLFLLEHVVQADREAPAAVESGQRWLHRSWAATHRHGSGRVYPNFPDPDLQNWAFAYHGTNYARLTDLKHTYDPYRLFDFPQAIGNLSHPPRPSS